MDIDALERSLTAKSKSAKRLGGTRVGALDLLFPRPDNVRPEEWLVAPAQWRFAIIPAWFAGAIQWLDSDDGDRARLVAALRALVPVLNADANPDHNAWHRAEARWMRAVLAIAIQRVPVEAEPQPEAFCRKLPGPTANEHIMCAHITEAGGLLHLVDALHAHVRAGDDVSSDEWARAEAWCARYADGRVIDEHGVELFRIADAEHRAMYRVAALTCEEVRAVDAVEGLGPQYRAQLVNALFEALETEAKGG